MSTTKFCIACEKSVSITNFARHKRTKEHSIMYHQMLKKEAKQGKYNSVL